MRVYLDLFPKPDAAGVPHSAVVIVDGVTLASGNGDTDADAINDLIEILKNIDDVDERVFDVLRSSHRAALVNVKYQT